MPRARRSVSNTQADRAGETYRAFHAATPGERRRLISRFLRALVVIRNYRALHAYPLRKVTMGVRQMIETELGPDPPRPGQRFKRMDRILPKLVRFPHMRLSQMEDIGGCRAVFETLDDLYTVAGRIRHRWGARIRMTDHIREPKQDGYRALHIIERRDGRLIEVQLRTERQHEWASAVEAAAAATGFNLKDGDGPDDLRRYFAMAAERLATEDQGEGPDPAIEEEFTRLREDVRHYFRRR
jgi:ppGpp synthetase/RelA/SpoT-type nucleotidyltranferase